MTLRRTSPARARARNDPVSVVLPAATRAEIRAEARRRGLGVSPTIRTLLRERIAELREERQLARARRWQLAQVMETWERSKAGEGRDVSWAEIDAMFDKELADGDAIQPVD